MAAITSDPVSIIREYEAPKRFWDFSKRKTVDETAALLMKCCLSTPLQNWGVVKKISREFKQCDNNTTVTDLKTSLCRLAKLSNWKDVLLMAWYQEEINVWHPFIQYANAIDNPIATKGRTLEFTGKEVLAVFGSTFSTNKSHRIDSKGHYLLDAAYGGICLDKQGNFNGYALALGDGAGGHFGEPVQDKRIARAAHVGTKTAVRLLSSYQDPESLKNELKALPSVIAQEMQEKVQGEGSTLICCRAFPLKNGYRLIGFNIGDGMMIAWNPALQIGHNICPSQVTEAGSAFLPETFKNFEIAFLDIIVTKGCYLYLLSDGVHDDLSYSESMGTYENRLQYRTRTLTHLDKVWSDISADAQARQYLEALVLKSFEGAENRRKREINNSNVQIGDDFSVMQCYLK